MKKRHGVARSRRVFAGICVPRIGESKGPSLTAIASQAFPYERPYAERDRLSARATTVPPSTEDTNISADRPTANHTA